jgi:hypothetical protein
MDLRGNHIVTQQNVLKMKPAVYRRPRPGATWSRIKNSGSSQSPVY